MSARRLASSRSAGSGIPALALVALAACARPALAESTAAERRGAAFWARLVEECSVPSGESAFVLVKEALGLLGSRASQWRDDVGYGVVASCAYRKRALTAVERGEIIERLCQNLKHGVGEAGTDSVLLRSFSALDLSVLAALESEDPGLDLAGWRRLMDAALCYLRDERDLRGFEPGVGFLHATAHTADLLKFLARDSRFTRADQQLLLERTSDRLLTPGTPVFTHGEEERLAAAVASVVRRSDFESASLDPWLERFVALEKRVWSQSPPDPLLLDAAQNGRAFLRSLHVFLSLPGRGAGATTGTGPVAGADAASRDRVLDALARIRR